eukprot:3865297-Rhodomonas_salina.3
MNADASLGLVPDPRSVAQISELAQSGADSIHTLEIFSTGERHALRCQLRAHGGSLEVDDDIIIEDEQVARSVQEMVVRAWLCRGRTLADVVVCCCWVGGLREGAEVCGLCAMGTDSLREPRGSAGLSVSFRGEAQGRFSARTTPRSLR